MSCCTPSSPTRRPATVTSRRRKPGPGPRTVTAPPRWDAGRSRTAARPAALLGCAAHPLHRFLPAGIERFALVGGKPRLEQAVALPLPADIGGRSEDSGAEAGEIG